ncbi:MAG: hypothetical protein JSW07_15495 [bacterium]|nr:MAG: hypothetical protein JSW07_15495 [bacterium]
MIESISEFESFVNGIKSKYREIKVSKLDFKNLGHTIGEMVGEIEFDKDIKLNISERIDFSDDMIASYRYEVYQGKDILYWYDPQPHPGEPSISITFPHHKHIHPNIKHHLVPAPGLGFNLNKITNLPFLIEEIRNNLIDL